MRSRLAASRRVGREFDEAWDKAWERITWPHDTVHRRDWKKVLGTTQPAWQRAYEQQPDPAEHQFMVMELAA